MGYNLIQTNPAYELVSDVIVSSATTSVDFTGLNFGKTDDLILVSTFNSTTAGSDNVYLYVNGNTTPTNYYAQYLIASGTSVSGARINVPQMYGEDSFKLVSSIAKIKLTNNGYLVSTHNSNLGYATSTLRLFNTATTSTFTITGITSLMVSATVTNGLGVGSRFQLYKRVAPIIADITVSSATTSVDITGLNIDKTGEYMLVSDYVSNGGGDLSIYFNGNETSTNYYRQWLSADASGVGATRNNNSFYIYAPSSAKSLCITNIKLTNNGYGTSQSNYVYNYGTSSVGLQNSYNTTTFTTTGITSIKIVGNTNVIGIGSRFQLIKLK